jgi:thymidylate synthase (FAD)
VTIRMITRTPDAESIMAYCARVSSNNQDNPEYAKLLGYCMKHGHWSVFEMADATYEIETTRDIAAQILRHRSFCFQEFSTRYAEVTDDIELAPARTQDATNRQNSVASSDAALKNMWNVIQHETYTQCMEAYKAAIAMGIAKELARKVLPLQTPTRLYMKGNLRSWITYCMVRCAGGTQLEHKEIADDIWRDIRTWAPTVAAAAEEIYPQLGGVSVGEC